MIPRFTSRVEIENFHVSIVSQFPGETDPPPPPPQKKRKKIKPDIEKRQESPGVV